MEKIGGGGHCRTTYLKWNIIIILDRNENPCLPRNSYFEEISQGLCKSNSVHGNSNCIGKGKNDANGSSKFST